jgi:hypothetical protein
VNIAAAAVHDDIEHVIDALDVSKLISEVVTGNYISM